MIYKNTKVYVVDNSGASVGECIHVYKKGKNRQSAGVGNLIKIAIKRLRKSIPKKRVKKSEVITALIVSTNRQINRKIGLSVKNGNNYVVLLNNELNNIISSRIVSPIFSEVRKFGYVRLLSIAPTVI